MQAIPTASLSHQRYYPLDPMVIHDPYIEYQRVREGGALCWMQATKY